jgi:hypothetical protein
MHNFWLYFWFLAGEILHVLAQSDLAKQSSANAYRTRLQYLQAKWVTILIRCLAGLGLFSLWLEAPDTFAKYGFSIPAAIPQISPVTGMLGFCADRALDIVVQKIPWRLADVPSLNNGAPKDKAA